MKRLSAYPYHLIKEDLRKRIQNKEWQGASRLPSSRNLAGAYGASVNTVEKAIKELCGEGLLTRDNRRGTYLADGAGAIGGALFAAGESGNDRTLGGSDGSGTASSSLFIGDSTDPRSPVRCVVAAAVIGANHPLWSAAFRGIEDALLPRGFRLLSSSETASPEQLDAFVNDAIARRVSGIILCPVDGVQDESRKQLYEKLAESGVPAVFLDRRVWHADIPFVTSDNAAGAYTLAKLLLAHGHRRIAFIRNSDLSTFYERLLGVRQACLESGMPFEPDYDICIPTRFENFADEYASFVERLELSLRAKRYTAIFAANDQIAEAALAALERLQLRVPADISLVTYDAQSLNERLKRDITGANQPFYEMGRSAALQLLRASEEARGEHRTAVAGQLCKAEIYYGSSVRHAKIDY
ncbi:GntR family transcriptional regulator [Paenibacillus silvisoli]|uniref:GntR family transcriptional regulator n=1 Tax=Paenibacillus silvisoli TaxID=3110539 RepID=UPI002B1BDD31|nr:GntR family transcriptional regulator [Paenibacillus silvisoli]